MTNAFEAIDGLPEEQRIVRMLIVETDEEILIEVEDSGKGISDNLFGRVLLEKVSTKNEADRGYGLMKVQENVSDLGGVIALETGDLGGALFIVSIPKGGYLYDKGN